MKHKVSKFKIKGGVDANQMLMKKLVRNFVKSGTMETSITKARYLVAKMQNLVKKAQENDHAAHNILLPYLMNKPAVLDFVQSVATRLGDRPASGSVKMLKLGMRVGDAAPIARVVWTNELPKTESKVKSTKSKAKEPKNIQPSQ